MYVFFEVGGYSGCVRHVLRNSIEKVPETGILALPNLVLSSNRAEPSLVKHRNTVWGPEGACISWVTTITVM